MAVLLDNLDLEDPEFGATEDTLIVQTADSFTVLGEIPKHYEEIRKRKSSNPEVNEILKALRANNPNMASISLLGKNITAAEAQLLAVELAFSSTVKSVYLNANKVGDEGAMYIAEALQYNRSVTAVNLNANGISDEGAKAIAQLIQTGKSCVSSWYLLNNSIGEAGESALRWAARRFPEVRYFLSAYGFDPRRHDFEAEMDAHERSVRHIVRQHRSAHPNLHKIAADF